MSTSTYYIYKYCTLLRATNNDIYFDLGETYYTF